MFDYGKEWEAERKAPAKTGDAEVGHAQGYRMFSPGELAEELVYLPAEPDPDAWVRDTRRAEPDERTVMDWGERNAEVDSQALELPDLEYGT